LFGEFEEGVRALLIDKDHRPQWLYKNIVDVPRSVIDAHFSYFDKEVNQKVHPLYQLEQIFGGKHV
jgi:hypothetical protein